MTATLNISEIRIDGKTQSRVEMNNDVIAEYAAAIQDGAEFPPITVFFDGSSYWLADGFHRLWAHKRAEKNLIKAEVIRGTQRDAILYSVSANASHGLRRSNADKRKAVMTLLEDSEWAKWSDREIARACSVSPDTVGRIRKDVTVRSDSEDKERTYNTKHGTETVMKTANIGKKKEEATPVAVKEPEVEKETAPVVDAEKEKLKELLAQAQELNSELAMDLEAAEINTSENKESEVRIAIQRLDTERSQKEMYMTKCNELIKQNRMLTNALNRKEKEIAELKKFIAENKIGEIDAAL